jgi:hypothetical protein
MVIIIFIDTAQPDRLTAQNALTGRFSCPQQATGFLTLHIAVGNQTDEAFFSGIGGRPVP